MKSPSVTLVSLLPAPEAVCSRWCRCKSLTDHRHLQVVLNVCVCVCVCVYVNEIWGSLVPAAEQNLFWWIQRRKTWKEDRICHMKQVLSWISSSFCVFIPSSSLRSHLASPVGLGWFPVTMSDWPTTRSKSCLRTPTPGTSPFPFTSVSADSQAPIFSVWLLASWPSFLNSSLFLWVS